MENFYHVMYEHLLKPINFQLRYCYPFGKTDTLLRRGNESVFWLPSPLVFCHFDQEPIYAHDETVLIDSVWMHRPHRFPKILANSEKSEILKTMCRTHDLLDWYFFYHGFAALDWYRDAIYFTPVPRVQHAYLSYNHLTRSKRAYRMALTARLHQRDILDRGIISFHGTPEDCQQEIMDAESPLSDISRSLIQDHLLDIDLPLTADYANIDGTASANFGWIEYQTRSRALFSVVNETVFFDPKLHLTEKIFQPIVCGRPFLLAAAPGNLAYLRSYGFQTFSDFVDESYDDETDPDKRLDMIANQIHMISKLSLSQLNGMLGEMQPILLHNKNHFFGDFKQIIIREFVNNFDTCIRRWNNGRVDGRQVTSHLDLDAVIEKFSSYPF